MAERGGDGLTAAVSGAAAAGPVFLLHVPKTGGQTLAHRLALGFAPERCSLLRADLRTPAQLAELAAQHEFFEAHPAAGVLASSPPGLRVMAAVRDPVEQIISRYRHILREPRLHLHPPAMALSPTAFLERFAHFMFDFQARTLVAASRAPLPSDRIGGEVWWLLRHLEPAVAGLCWLLPSEAIDEFCTLWALAERRPVGPPELRVNAGPADHVDAAALRGWLRARAERFAVDAVLWEQARLRHAEWRGAVLAATIATGDPPPGTLAWTDDDAAIWLTRDWHRPARRADGIFEWWSGPGFFPRVRLRRGGRARLHFEGAAFLGVRWDKLRLFRAADLRELPLQRSFEEGTHIARYTASIGELGPEEELVLYGLEDITVLPAVPLALETPRRGWATQHWRLD